MMRKLGAMLCGVVLAIVGAAVAVVPGGFPSRPQLQAVGVGVPAGATGTVTATQLIGAINASSLNQGTVPDARLSTNVPLLNAGANTFTGNIAAQGANIQFGKTSGNPFGQVSIATPGSTFGLFSTNDPNGNQLCVGINHSGSAQCNIPSGGAGLGSTDVGGLTIAAGTHNITLSTTGAIQVAGTPSSVPWATPAQIPKMAACEAVIFGTTLTFTNHFNCTSITRSNVGRYLLDVTAAGFGVTRPVCSIQGSDQLIYEYVDPSTNTFININTVTPAGGFAEATRFFVFCTGQ